MLPYPYRQGLAADLVVDSAQLNGIWDIGSDIQMHACVPVHFVCLPMQRFHASERLKRFPYGMW